MGRGMFARTVTRAVWRQSALQRHMSCNMGGGGPECSGACAEHGAVERERREMRESSASSKEARVPRWNVRSANGNNS